MKARDIMTPRPFVVTPADPIAAAAEIMRYEDIGGVPVVDARDRRRLVGLITDRDITTRWVARGHHAPCTVGEVMTPAPLQMVTADTDIGDILAMMEAAEVRRIPVISDDGVLIGIVAEADLAARLAPREPLPLRKRVKRWSPEVRLPA